MYIIIVIILYIAIFSQWGNIKALHRTGRDGMGWDGGGGQGKMDERRGLVGLCRRVHYAGADQAESR